MKTTLLLDADIVAYKYSAANEKAWNFDGPDAEPLRSADLGAAIDCARDFVAELRETLGASEVIVCLSDPTNRYFRHDIYPNYKGSRRGTRKPEHLMAVKHWLAENFQTYMRPTLEADDCMGILATHPSLIKGDKIMVSEDKDMKTIPGLLYNPREGGAVKKVSKLSADRFFLTQTIIGDTCDGYPGARGVGPKSEFVSAINTAKTIGEMWHQVTRAFMKANPALAPEAIQEAALSQARLARILRASDWDFSRKAPHLWFPCLGAGVYKSPRA